MALLTEQRLRDLAKLRTSRVYKTAQSLLVEVASTTATSFDVFLSHAIKDAELVLGAKEYLDSHGLRVYVDWIVDSDVDRSQVSPATAELLRQRMRQSQSLLYLHTENSPNSKWMPWELGYFDGLNGRVGILPVVRLPRETFSGQEYLGLYPYVDEAPAQGAGNAIPWINRSVREYANFSQWLAGAATIRTH